LFFPQFQTIPTKFMSTIHAFNLIASILPMNYNTTLWTLLTK
jgi:hypothetical protein